MDQLNLSNMITREVDITTLSPENKRQLQKYYFEMPADVRTSIAINFQDIFPEVTPRMFLHMTTADADAIIKMSSDLLKIFNHEMQEIRFLLPASWFDSLKLTIFIGSWNSETLMKGLNMITELYHEVLPSSRRNKLILQFMANFLEAWLLQKERGMLFYSKIFYTAEYSRLTQSPMSLAEIVVQYVDTPATALPARATLENMFFTKLMMEPSEDVSKNIFAILDVISAANVVIDRKYNYMLTMESTEVSRISENEVADNRGQVLIFGKHDFGLVPVETVKEELLRLNRNTLAEYLGGKASDSVISFNISDQTKMMIQEELSPNLCSVAIKRGNEMDMATLLILENKIYLLFRKNDVTAATFGISIGRLENGDRELIGISNESEFTYSLVGSEEIGIKE